MGKVLIEVIEFLKKFKEYQEHSNQDLKEHLQPSFNLNQYKIFKDKEIIGFINWAFLNDIQKTKFINHAIIDQTNWNCGNNLCVANFVCSKNINDMVNWCKDFARNIKYDKEIVWVKAFRNNRIIRVNKQWQR
jgi:hemolysin-activating ACP:hemolysin acyltransferase